MSITFCPSKVIGVSMESLPNVRVYAADPAPMKSISIGPRDVRTSEKSPDDARLRGFQAADRIAMAPELEPMHAVTSVQQPCSNPSKSPEKAEKAPIQKYSSLQLFCKLRKCPAKYRAAFARRRSGGRIPSAPLKKQGFCRKNLGPKMSARLLAASLCSNANRNKYTLATVGLVMHL